MDIQQQPDKMFGIETVPGDTEPFQKFNHSEAVERGELENGEQNFKEMIAPVELNETDYEDYQNESTVNDLVINEDATLNETPNLVVDLNANNDDDDNDSETAKIVSDIADEMTEMINSKFEQNETRSSSPINESETADIRKSPMLEFDQEINKINEMSSDNAEAIAETVNALTDEVTEKITDDTPVEAAKIEEPCQETNMEVADQNESKVLKEISNTDENSNKSNEASSEASSKISHKPSETTTPQVNGTSKPTTNGHINGTANSTAYKTDKSLNYYKSLSGKIRKFGSSYVFKQENIKSYTDTFGIDYKIGDHVYMDINKPNQPFAIACVLDFKLTKRDNVVIEVRWYFRPNEIPDSVYMPLMQDRHSEIASAENADLAVLEPIIKGRELFASESTDIYPATFIKGKSRVFHYQDILEAKNFKPFADTFFCILTYNPEARRMANTHGEIRVGPSHQAKMPECEDLPAPCDESVCEDSESPLWKYKEINDPNLFAYLQAARSIAAFAGMCERGNQDDMYDCVQSDSTTIQALKILNECEYNTSKALNILLKNQTPKTLEQKWCEEDQKKFVKGLSQYGKNFFRMRKELLLNKTTSEIVEYYYLWKKTSAAQNNRFRRRLRPSSVKKMSQIPSNKKPSASINNISNNTNNNNTNNEQFSGGSEMDSDNDSDESSDQKSQSAAALQKCCTNCFTNSSKDLQNGGLDNQLLCYDCRMYYKKYGELPRIPNAKSETNTPEVCEFTNQLVKLESDSRNERENLNNQITEALKKNDRVKQETQEIKTESTKEEVNDVAMVQNEPQTIEKNIEPTNSIEIKAEKEISTTKSELESDKIENDQESDEELGEIKSYKTKNEPREIEQEKETNQKVDTPRTESRNEIKEQKPAPNLSMFQPVSSSHSKLPQFPGEIPNKLNLSSSSPKPAFSPMNYLNSPGPSQSPIPSFNPLAGNPLGMPFNPLAQSAFSHFFPPMDMQQQQQMYQHSQKQQQQQAHSKGSSSQLNQSSNSSTCSSPTPDITQEELLRPAVPCNVTINKQPDLIKPDSNAMFVRIWDRGSNTCSRTDLNFKYLPNAKYKRSKTETKSGSHHSSSNGSSHHNGTKTSSSSNINGNSNSSNNGNSSQKTNNSSKDNGNNSANSRDNQPSLNPNDPKIPPHLLPFFNMMAAQSQNPHNQNPQRPVSNNPMESEANFINELMKNQFYNSNGNPNPQMNMQNLQKQTQQQKIAFTEAQILEQAKRSLESNYQQMAFNQQFNGDPKNMPHPAGAPNFLNNQQQHKFPPVDFEMNPALKQLRDIADARSNIPNPFPGMNPNAFNNGFNKSNHFSR